MRLVALLSCPESLLPPLLYDCVGQDKKPQMRAPCSRLPARWNTFDSYAISTADLEGLLQLKTLWLICVLIYSSFLRKPSLMILLRIDLVLVPSEARILWLYWISISFRLRLIEISYSIKLLLALSQMLVLRLVSGWVQPSGVPMPTPSLVVITLENCA